MAEVCKVSSTKDFITQIVKICNDSVKLGLLKAPSYIENAIRALKETAEATSEPEQQVQLLRKALDSFYSPEGMKTPYGSYLSQWLVPNAKDQIFNKNITAPKAEENNTVSSTYEETAKASKQIRQRNFLESQFKDAPNAKLYFQRSVKTDMVETFLVERSGENPRYFTSQGDMNENVRVYKQKLLDRVFNYLDNNMFSKGQVKSLPRQMYSEGNYTDVIKKIKSEIDKWLAPKVFTQNNVKPLEAYYTNYRDGKNSTDKAFLDAYNAWITLNNFDTIVTDTMGSIIKVSNDSHYNRHTGDLTKYEIKGRASNMWNNWTTSDDIADMSEVISDVTQVLIETSKMYKWKSGEAYSDRYVSFNDFNHVIGKIKRWVNDPKADTIFLNNLNWEDGTKPSIHTQRLMLDILSWNRLNGNMAILPDGTRSNLPKAVTFKQLISRINENPQRYFHAIFDLLCNTDILSNFTLNDYERNLIWSFNKEVFGGDSETRSLYRLHTATKQDNIYQIITQVAASTFPEDYLQYYEKNDGTISTRLLQDYAVDRVKNDLLNSIQQTASTIDATTYKEYGITGQSKITLDANNKKFLNYIQISIPTIIDGDKTANLNIKVYANSMSIDFPVENAQQIWENPKIQNLIKDTLGINFNIDPDLKASYIETVGGAYEALMDLGKLVGRAVFNAALNNRYVPYYKDALTNPATTKEFIELQFGKDKASEYTKGIDRSTGLIPVLSIKNKDALVKNLALANAINSNLLAQAQSKTGEGTSLANFTLSRMRNFYQNQVEMQCKKERSALKDLSFVVNSNGLFEGILSRRELKTLKSNQQSTQFSDQQSFKLSFINDFISGFTPNFDDTAYIKNGRVSFLPTVNSDKTQIDGLLVNLRAKSRIPDGRGGFKTYMELTDSEIEQEMILEFKPMYERIIDNINTELNKIYDLLSTPVKNAKPVPVKGSVIMRNQALLDAINHAFQNDESLGKSKDRVINGLHKLITRYNKTHSRNPIMLASHVHYVVNGDGLLESNKTLEALWGRFNPTMTQSTRNRLLALYSKEPDYLAYLSRNNLNDPLSTNSFFKYKEHLTVENLLKMDFKVYLYGSDDKVRYDQEEIKFLRGQAMFTEAQMADPAYASRIQLNNEMKNWVGADGLMILAKGTVWNKDKNVYEEVAIKTLDQLNEATNLKVHPMLSKLNRLDYLCSQQYTIATVGSHYAHKGKGGSGSVLVEEAQRWLASNKRNVAATSTVHLFQNKQLDGAPSVYNVSIIEDVRFDLYNVMGDLYLEGHAPLDGGMFVNAWMSELENNSLAGEKAGIDKKQFGTFFSELYGAGGIVKTAGFAATNSRMRRQKAWRNLQKAMTSKPWVKEHADEFGNDIPEILDITKNFFVNDANISEEEKTIDYNKVLKGQPVRYKRPAHDNPNQLAAYQLDHIESLGNNQYRIHEFEIDAKGNPVSEVMVRIENQYFEQDFNEDGRFTRTEPTDIITINNNWDLFTKVFGGYNSLELGNDGYLTWSENSIKLMVHAINNVGYRKDFNTYQGHEYSSDVIDYASTVTEGLDQDDIWQPLKYSDVHYTPNIGAIKSLQFNVNPDGDAVLEGKSELNHFAMRLAQLGIQLDKEHHADASDVSMPTQIIQATANKSYTSEYSKEIYNALATLTKQATNPFLEGIKEIITSDKPDTLVEEVTNLIVDNLLHQSGDDTSINAILKDLMDKVDRGDTLKYKEDIKNKIPWSDPTIMNKLFSSLSTTLTNLAVKMKFAGTLSVICPTDRVEKIHGDRMLNSFTEVFDENGSTRTNAENVNMTSYQKSVRDGNEVDSDGRNMLIFDISRDLYSLPRHAFGESIEEYQARLRKSAALERLSKVSELKTQHNYIIEFNDGSKENVTINTPEDYYRIKNLVIYGRKSEQLQYLPTPITYDEMLETNSLELAEQLPMSQQELESNPYYVICQVLAGQRLTYESVQKETGFGRSEMKKLIGLYRSKESGGVSIEHLAELIYADNPQIFEDDYQVRSLIIDIIGSSHTMKDITQYSRFIYRDVARQKTNADYALYEKDILEKTGYTAEQYAVYHDMLSKKQVPVKKIYEDVETGRALGAYNVRFTDKNTGQRFQIYDLDSINLLFNLNRLSIGKAPKGYTAFDKISEEEQQQVLNKIFNSSAFPIEELSEHLQTTYPNIPLGSNSVIDFNNAYPGKLNDIITEIHKFVKPRIYRSFQNDLFKLSSNYNKNDRQVYANGVLIDPMDIQTDAYELIMPKIYKTQFGLKEFDDLQAILRDKDFFVKRGLERFSCKLAHHQYDYELKNFNGEHFYILDKTKGIPEELQNSVQPIFIDKKKNKTYRVDSNGHVIHELSSDDDSVLSVGGVQIIVTDNPLFYVQNMNYNTLKVSPKRVTEESYQTLIDTLQQSKRKNSQNFLKAIQVNGQYFDLNTFKEFNEEMDSLTYEKLQLDTSDTTQFKSTAQICRILLQNGRELHTSFDESLNLIAGRIPAQSQQSFMTQRVIGFDSSDINTAMVSTFQLFLQGSDLDIDAVTLLGYEFDKNGKFVAWSPYFDIDSKEKLQASKNIPLPTGEVKSIYAGLDAKNNFFEVYDKYFGTLFKPITVDTNGKIKTTKKNNTPLLQMEISTPEGLNLLAEFLRDFNKYGINIKAELVNGQLNVGPEFFEAPPITLGDGTSVKRVWNIFDNRIGGVQAKYEHTYNIAEQLLNFANIHNNYLNTAEEHLRDKMSKNYIVHYIYKVAEAPSNQVEAQKSVDESTKQVKYEAAHSAMGTASNSYAPGGSEVKHKSVGEGQAGKAGVGIGAVAIKANSTTQFYISELLNYGSEADLKKLFFPGNGITISGKTYQSFANMYTSSERDLELFTRALEYINQLEDPNEITRNVAEHIASLLSIAVDNAKDLALSKINAGPRLMGMYAYGLTLGVPIEQLVKIMNSDEGRILTAMTEGCQFNNDITAFRILDVFDKLNGNIGGDLSQFDYVARNADGKAISADTQTYIKVKTTYGTKSKQLQFRSTTDALFAAMYPEYSKWFDDNNIKGSKAESFGAMVSQLLKNGKFSEIYQKSDIQAIRNFAISINNQLPNNPEIFKNWSAAQSQLITYIKDMEKKINTFKSSPIAKDLRVLAEGAEEMRVLGSILSINKGLKATVSETEAFIDTIENLIYDRKLAMGWEGSETDKVDFHKFMTSKKYQEEVIEKYEKVKHSVNIPHLLSIAPHFKGYLTTEIIPTSFFTTASVKYRTLSKYRKNVNADAVNSNANPQSLFKMFGVDSKRDKEAILKGLENLIQFKLFTRWAYDKKLEFKVPKNFKYFVSKNQTAINTSDDFSLKLHTLEGLASFKKYMEEVFIPQLKSDPDCANNTFVKNLTKISFDKTPLHNTIIVYSLPGDLMARTGRQAELNAKMFADFQSLAHYQFQPGMSLIDAFYIYSQYCYMGKKGQKSLMSLFDSTASRSSLSRSFNEHVAKMDTNGNLSCSREELIIWCAPSGNQFSKSNWAYVTSNKEWGVSLKERIPEHVNLSEEEQALIQEQLAESGEEEGQTVIIKEKFGTYKNEYLVSQYDRLTKNNFLVPSTNDKVGFTLEMPLTIFGGNYPILLSIKSDMIQNVTLTMGLNQILSKKIEMGQTKFKSLEEFTQTLTNTLRALQIPYKVSLFKDQRKELDFGILQPIIEQLINC